VLIRSLNDSASRIPGVDVGADDFISKSFNAHELRTRIGWLRRK
jgi:DNA-binding response OmpR family regulator